MDWNMVEALGTWFAGLATAGSFWLGFTILWSDRRKEEQAQAKLIYVHPQLYTDQVLGRKLQVRVRNDSDRSIFLIAMGGLREDTQKRYGFDTHAGWRASEWAAGSNDLLTMENVKEKSKKKLYVIFVDSNHVVWKYNLGKHKLSKYREPAEY